MDSKTGYTDYIEGVHKTQSGTSGHGETVLEGRIHESRMEAALMQEKPYAWRKSFLKLYAVIFVGYLCSATNGFDANTFGRLSAFTPLN